MTTQELKTLIAEELMGWEYGYAGTGQTMTWGMPGAEKIRHNSWCPVTRMKDIEDVTERLYRDITCVQLTNAEEGDERWLAMVWGPEVQRRSESGHSHARARGRTMGEALCRAVVLGYDLKKS